MSTPLTEDAVVRRFVDACNHGDMAVVADSFAEDATFTIWGGLSMSGTATGRRAIVEEFMHDARALFRPGTLRLELDTLTSEGRRVVAEVTARGESAAGDPYVNRYCMVFDVADGRLQAVREYMDTAYAERVLGRPSA